MHTIIFGPFSLSAGHAMLIIAFLSAAIVGAVVSRKNKAPVVNTLFDLLWVGLLVARLGFILLYFDYYRDNLWSMVNIRDGGFNFWFGLLGAGLVLVYKLMKRPVLRRLMMPALLAGGLSYAMMAVWVNVYNSKQPRLPDSQVLTLEGKPTHLTTLAAGKPLVLNLWASWCPPCIREMPVLAQAQVDYPDVAFVFANQGEDTATIKGFLAKEHIHITNVISDDSYQLRQITHSPGLPTTLFYSADGQQVYVHIGELSAATLARGMRYFKEPLINRH